MENMENNMENIHDNIMDFRKVAKIRKQNQRDIALARAEMERTTALVDIEMEKLKNEMKLEPTRDEVDVIKCNLDSKKNLKKKAWLYLTLAIVYSTASAAMSILGLAHQGSFEALGTALRGRYGIASIVFWGLQIGIMVYSQSSHCIEKDFFRIIKKLRIIQKAIICSLFYCKYQFMCEMIGNEGLASKIICGILSASCDIMSLNFSELATNIKFRIYSHSDDFDMTGGLFSKLYIIMFGSLLAKIDKKYNQRIQEIKAARLGQDNEPDAH